MNTAADALLDACPPRDLDIEAAALGAMLLDPAALAVGLRELHKDDFTEPQHAILFSSLAEAATSVKPGERLDLPILEAGLRAANLWDRVGGRARLLALCDASGAMGNIGAYARILRDKTALRLLRDAAAEILRLSAKPDTRPRKIIRLLERAVEKAARRAAGESEGAETPILTCLADVTPQAVGWLWRLRIPLSRITLLVGRQGEGKGFLSMDWASRVSTGTPWPDGSACPLGSVLIISGEDDPADVLAPRLLAMRANMSKIHILSGVRIAGKDAAFTLENLEALEAVLKAHPDIRLIIVDPIGSFIGGDTETNLDNKVRAVLDPLAALAAKYGPAVLIVAHRRKSSSNFADDLALGSRAFVALSRSVLHLTRDPENKARRLLLGGKSNLGPECDGLAFSIAGDPPAVIWERGGVPMRADDALALENAAGKHGPAGAKQVAAEAWLRTFLADGPRLAEDCFAQAAGVGIKEGTLKRAKDAAGVVAKKEGFTDPWFWSLLNPEEAQVAPY